jgi:hypothetical protein
MCIITIIIKTYLIDYLSSIYYVNNLYMLRVCYCTSSGGVTLYETKLVRVMVCS